MEPITVSIQEIVHEFEELVRFEERIITLDEIDMLDESDCEEFLKETEHIAQKYIPNYLEILPDDYYSPRSDSKDKAMIISEMLQDNFREIFFKLV